jgi:hypothetical protein
MRRRALTTTKILSVALAMTPACTKPEVHPDPGANTAAAMLSAPSPSSAPSEDPKLLALRTELGALKRDEALKQVEHFRPLCDANGYPLVGNLQRKAPDPELMPSEVCAEIRKKKIL